MVTDNLTDTAIRKAVPGDKPRKLTDGGGLYLELRPNGARWWRLKYRFGGKEKLLSMGVYPEVTLATARKRRDEARTQVAHGIDPSDVRKAGKAADAAQAKAMAPANAGLPAAGTFEAVAREWLAKAHEPAVSVRYALRSRKQLEGDVFPWIGHRLARDVSAPMVLL